MRCLLILRMQRRVELLLLRGLRILMELAGGKLPREMELQKSVYVCGRTAERSGD